MIGSTGFRTLVYKETLRFYKVATQTVALPADGEAAAVRVQVPAMSAGGAVAIASLEVVAFVASRTCLSASAMCERTSDVDSG